LSEKIKSIQVYNQSGELVYECSKGFSVHARGVHRNPVDDILVLKGKNMPAFDMGTPVDIVITARNGERQKYFCKVAFYNGNQLRLIIDTEKARSLENHRRYYRIKTAINCRIVDITRGEDVTAYNPNLYGKIYDINIGGVFMAVETPEKYRVDDLISLTAILNSNKLEVTARVLRIQESDNGEVLGYRCSFVSISPHKEDLISSYINYLQLEERRVEIELEKLEKGISE